MSSRRSCRRLPPISASIADKPVTFPPPMRTAEKSARLPCVAAVDHLAILTRPVQVELK
jgi:hypothetical protein